MIVSANFLFLDVASDTSGTASDAAESRRRRICTRDDIKSPLSPGKHPPVLVQRRLMAMRLGTDIASTSDTLKFSRAAADFSRDTREGMEDDAPRARDDDRVGRLDDTMEDPFFGAFDLVAWLLADEVLLVLTRLPPLLLMMF